MTHKLPREMKLPSLVETCRRKTESLKLVVMIISVPSRRGSIKTIGPRKGINSCSYYTPPRSSLAIIRSPADVLFRSTSGIGHVGRCTRQHPTGSRARYRHFTSWGLTSTTTACSTWAWSAGTWWWSFAHYYGCLLSSLRLSAGRDYRSTPTIESWIVSSRSDNPWSLGPREFGS